MDKILSAAKKWFRRLAMAYMLGFANAINQEVKTMDDTFFKTEEVQKDKKGWNVLALNHPDPYICINFKFFFVCRLIGNDHR